MGNVAERIGQKMVTLPIEGGCFCGQIRYRITQMPRSVGVCHCEYCRRCAGAESVGWAVIETEGVAIIERQPHHSR